MAAYIPLTDQDAPDLSSTLPQTTPWTLNSEKYVSRRVRMKARLISALPRFAQPGAIKHRKIGPTSYLDALRGYAACIVFIAHSFNSKGPSWRLQPFISLFFDGAGMVALFFIISGYALGYRLLILTRKQESEKLLNSLASSMFRRYFRLYASSLVAMFYAFVLVRMGVYDGMHPPLHKPTLWLQIVDFWWDVIHFLNPFADMRGWVNPGVFDSRYLSLLWSIPIEYRGSVALFAFILATCKLTPRARIVCMWVIIVLCYVWQACYVSEFLAGLFIAELTLLRHPERLGNTLTSSTAAAANNASNTPPSRIPNQQPSPAGKIGLVALFILGILLLGQPDHEQLGIWGSFPWHFLKSWVPWWWEHTGRHMFWLGPGSFFVCFALEFYPALQRPLNWRWSQYIGDLSFGIYVVHMPTVIACYYNFLIPLQARYLGTSYFAFAPGVVATILIVFTAADYFCRIDAHVVRLARWLQNRLFIQWQ